MQALLAHSRACLGIGLAFGFSACTSNTGNETAEDLPSGWASALHVSDFVQMECAGGELDFADEGVAFQPMAASLGVTYDKAHFRCEQDVEGFYKVAGGALDILVQPVDMHPESVAACDCPYGITFNVKPLAAGSFQVTLYRRWDAMNKPNDPVAIGSEQVTIE